VKTLDKISKQLLGVSIADIESVFKSSR